MNNIFEQDLKRQPLIEAIQLMSFKFGKVNSDIKEFHDNIEEKSIKRKLNKAKQQAKNISEISKSESS